MTKITIALCGIAVAILAACGSGGVGAAQPAAGLDAPDPAWVSAHPACGDTAETVNIRWVTSSYHDTDLVGYGGEEAGWAGGELCVRGRVTWAYALGGRAGVTIRAQGQPVEDDFDHRLWLNRNRDNTARWQKFVGIVPDLPARPEQVKLAVKLYNE